MLQQWQTLVNAQLPVGRLPREVFADGLREFPSAEGWKAFDGPADQIKIRLDEEPVPDPERWVNVTPWHTAPTLRYDPFPAELTRPTLVNRGS